jgi:CRISPR/Cas system CMR-associated protein Cmr1 (group 7 of RAMP superfamily)
MCNFAAELKHVAYKEKLVDIQWDNTFRRETLKPSKKARYKPNYQSANLQAFKAPEKFQLSISYKKNFVLFLYSSENSF